MDHVCITSVELGRPVYRRFADGTVKEDILDGKEMACQITVDGIICKSDLADILAALRNEKRIKIVIE